MSEKFITTASPSDDGDRNRPVPKLPAVAPAVVTGEKSAAAMVQPPAAVSKSPALFGGHKGGGKKRADGLVAGSPEAIAADKEKDAARKRADRAAQKAATQPPPLPSAAPATANAPVSQPADLAPVPAAVAGVAGGQPMGMVPTFVAWSAVKLARPVKLLTKVIDRFRCSKLMEKVRGLGLDRETEKEVEQRMRYKQEQLEDFNSALTTCMVEEFNKRRVPGAEHSHWLELGMAGAELVNCHLDTLDFLEKKLLERAEREQKNGQTGQVQHIPANAKN